MPLLIRYEVLHRKMAPNSMVFSQKYLDNFLFRKYNPFIYRINLKDNGARHTRSALTDGVARPEGPLARFVFRKKKKMRNRAVC